MEEKKRPWEGRLKEPAYPGEISGVRMELCMERAASLWETRWEQAGLPGLELPTFEKLEAPADLGSWVCPATVLAWVARGVELQEWSAFKPADGMQQLSAHDRELMLCVLAYAYARQMFDAAAIA